METKEENMKKRISTYLNKTSMHLFMTDSDKFYKLLVYKHENRLNYVKLLFDDNNIEVEFMNNILEGDWYHPEALAGYKRNANSRAHYFMKKRSIKKIKRFLPKFDELIEYLKTVDSETLNKYPNYWQKDTESSIVIKNKIKEIILGNTEEEKIPETKNWYQKLISLIK